MTSKPPYADKLEIRQPLTAADTARVDALDAIIILLPESSLQKRWPDFPHSERLKKRVPEGKTSLVPTRADLPNPRGTVAIMASYKNDASAFDLLTLARKCVAKARETEPMVLGLLLPACSESLRPKLAEALVAAVAASNFDPPLFKGEEERHTPYQQPHPVRWGKGPGTSAVPWRKRKATALARWLTILPRQPSHAHRVSRLREGPGPARRLEVRIPGRGRD